ncbi:MAG: hypothetical protein QM729_15660 [Solirubrobacterales bacterium]
MPRRKPATFAEELAWSIECLEEAEASVRRCLRIAGDEERPIEVGKRLKLRPDWVRGFAWPRIATLSDS